MLPIGNRVDHHGKETTTMPSERAPLYTPNGHEYGAKAAYFIDEVTGDRPWWNILVFEWFSPLIELGNTKHLTASDLFPLRDSHQTVALATQFEPIWASERSRRGKRALLWLAVLRTFPVRFLLAGSLKFTCDTLMIMTPPVVIYGIITYLEDPTSSIVQGLFYTVLVLVCGTIHSLARRHFEYFGSELGLFIEASVSSAVFAHALVVSPSALQRAAPNEVVGHLSTSAQRLRSGVMALYNAIGALIQVGLGGWLLYQFMGNAVWAGVVAFAGTIPCGYLLENVISRRKNPLMDATHERDQVSQELFSGIRPLKLQAWERVFVNRRVMPLRLEELQLHRSSLFASGCKTALTVFTPVLVCSVALLAYTKLVGGPLDVATTLPALTILVLLLHGPLLALPHVVLKVVDARKHLCRITAFLTEPIRATTSGATEKGTSCLVVMKNADFKWDAAPLHQQQQKTELDLLMEAQGISLLGDKEEADEANEPVTSRAVLHHINFYAEPGEVYAVVGPQESGKSTLLAGVIGIARCSAGDVTVRGSLAFVGNDPFLLCATVRDNVLFGSPYEADRYDNAIRMSYLHYDLRALPKGDRTMVGGERGSSVPLTLNQRVRVEFARSLYRNPDIYVLDDVLSAMDPRIAMKMFKNLVKMAREQGKIVILATHSLPILKKCSSMVVLGRGTIMEAGSFSTLMANKKWALLADIVRTRDGKTIEEEVAATSTVDADDDDGKGSTDFDLKEDDATQLSFKEFAPCVQEDDCIKAAEQQTNEEDTNEENVRLAVALWLARLCGDGAIGGYIAVGTFVVVAVASCLFPVFALSWITQEASGGPPSSLVEGFIAFALLHVLLTIASSTVAHYSATQASQSMFQALVDRLSRAPTAFFDMTPSNRLASRLAKDLSVLDTGLPTTWPRWVACGAHLAVTTGVVLAVISPWLALVCVPLVSPLYKLGQCIGTPSRDLKRLSAVTTGPVQSCGQEVLRGMTPIRLHKADHLFRSQLYGRIDNHHQAAMLKKCADCWLGIRVDLVYVALVTCCTALAAVHVHPQQQATTAGSVPTTLPIGNHAGRVAVALLFACSISPVLMGFLKLCDDMRTLLVAGGRIKAYSKMPVEASLDSSPELRVDPQWPTNGAITFDNVSVRFRTGLPRVLRGVSFAVCGGENVAVISSTAGSGKKTLFMAMTRLVELTSGSITVDGVDISKMGLHDLRTKISWISFGGSMMFFAGTIRSNLDLTRTSTDDQVWRVIQCVGLQDVVMSLDEVVQENGVNYSASERIQLSMARAILKKPKIVLVDEGDFAMVEPSESTQIDQCLHQEFATGTTRLTITQRATTAAEAAKVLILENGQVVEFGSPQILQKNPKSKYRGIVDDWKRRDRTISKKT